MRLNQKFTFEKRNDSRTYDFFFDKSEGAIITTSHLSQKKIFEQLQKNIESALIPLIQLIDKIYEKESEKYSETGGTLVQLPRNHKICLLIDLKCILQANNKFFGKYKKPLPANALQIKSLLNPLDEWAKELANVTGVDYKEAYKLLLKINACKEHYYFSYEIPSLKCTQFFIQDKSSESYYKAGVEDIISFADFQKKIEKSIAYMVLKTTQNKEQEAISLASI